MKIMFSKPFLKSQQLNEVTTGSERRRVNTSKQTYTIIKNWTIESFTMISNYLIRMNFYYLETAIASGTTIIRL